MLELSEGVLVSSELDADGLVGGALVEHSPRRALSLHLFGSDNRGIPALALKTHRQRRLVKKQSLGRLRGELRVAGTHIDDLIRRRMMLHAL